MKRLLTILQLSRPIYLLFTALTYFLGAGIARYLGHPPVYLTFWFGFVIMVFAQISMNLLVEVFRPVNEPIGVGEIFTDRKFIRDYALYLSIACLAAIAVIVFLFYRENRLTPAAWVYLALSLLVIFVYSVPPFRLFDKGFGEVLLAIHMGFIVPSIAFLLQSGRYHPLLNTTVVPVAFIALASLLALDFPSYAVDLKYARQTLLVRIGWERAVPLHHGLVVIAYVLFAFEPLFGFSFRLLWPAFLTLPFALLQVYLLRNISMGAKPIWGLLTANAISIFGLTAYFLTLAFWLR